MNVLLQLVLVFGLPWLIGRFSSLFIKEPKIPVDEMEPPKSRLHNLVSTLLISGFFYFCYQAFANAPINFFNEIGIACDAPNFVMRNEFRDFVATQRANDDHFEFSDESIKLPRSAYKLFAYEDDEEPVFSRYDLYYALFELLKTKVNRRIYLNFGEFAFLNCDWCSDYYDYYWFSLAHMIMPYVLVGIFLSFVGMVKPFGNHLSWAGVLIAWSLMAEVMTTAMPDSYLTELGIVFPLLPFNRHFFVFRNAIFAFVFIVMWLGRNSKKLESTERYEFIIDKEKEIFDRLKVINFQKEAVLEDEKLFSRFVKFYGDRVGSILGSGTAESQLKKGGQPSKDNLDRIKDIAKEALSNKQEPKLKQV